MEKPIIEYYKSGEVCAKRFYLEDVKLHRIDKPAYISYYLSGKKHSESWWLNDKRHRIDGPALVVYEESGKIICKEFYFNGRCIKKARNIKDFKKAIKLLIID